MLSGLKPPASVLRGGSGWGAGEHEGVESGIGGDTGRSGFFVLGFLLGGVWGVRVSVEVSVQRAESGDLRELRVWNPNTQRLGAERFCGGRSLGSLAQVRGAEVKGTLGKGVREGPEWRDGRGWELTSLRKLTVGEQGCSEREIPGAEVGGESLHSRVPMLTVAEFRGPVELSRKAACVGAENVPCEARED